MKISFFAFLMAACTAPVIYSQTADSTSAGGGWVRVEHKNSATGAQSASYVLSGETIDLERHPSVVLTCDGAKPPSVVYHTDINLATQAHNVYNHYADSIWVQVKVDEGKPYKAIWEIVPGDNHVNSSVLPDRKTVRSLFEGQKLRVRFRDYQDEDHLDVFDLAGLNTGVSHGDCSPSPLAKNSDGDAAKSSRGSRHP